MHLWNTLMPAVRTRPDEGDLTCGPSSTHPIGELRLVEHDGAITAIEFSPFRDGRRPRRAATATTTTRCSSRPRAS